VTDHAIFSSVMDVFIEEEYRLKGIGTKLMKAIVTHPSVSRTVCILSTEWAHHPDVAARLYKKCGFLPYAGYIMVRVPR
jgi:GNAT superfamily N-acetyltransferase